jgi:hypothetical protein
MSISGEVEKCGDIRLLNNGIAIFIMVSLLNYRAIYVPRPAFRGGGIILLKNNML